MPFVRTFDVTAGRRSIGLMRLIFIGSRWRRGRQEPRYHAVSDEGVPLQQIAGVIGRRLNVPVVSQSAEEAAEHFGWFAHFLAMDNPASSERTRELLGWKPKQPGLIADLDRPSYFAEANLSASLR